MQLNLSKVKLTRNLMPSEKEGVMIILSSPSGAGKTTLASLLSNNNIKTNNSKPFLLDSIVAVVKTVYS